VREGRRYIPSNIAARLADRTMQANLASRELQTLEALAKGLTNKQIAATMNLTYYTIRIM
jgi:DNA-binding NarL/FixJ family response regulator